MNKANKELIKSLLKCYKQDSISAELILYTIQRILKN